jgi:hypothetical protein
MTGGQAKARNAPVYRICCNTKLHRQHYRYQHPLNNPFRNNCQWRNWHEMDPNTINTKNSTTEHTYTAIHSTLPTANSGTPPSFLSFPPQGRNMEAQMGCNLQHTDMCELNLTRSTNSAQRRYTYWHNLLTVEDAPFGGSLFPTNTSSKENKLCPNTTQQRRSQPTPRTGDNSLFSKNALWDVYTIPFSFMRTSGRKKSHAIKHNQEKWSSK